MRKPRYDRGSCEWYIDGVRGRTGDRGVTTEVGQFLLGVDVTNSANRLREQAAVCFEFLRLVETDENRRDRESLAAKSAEARSRLRPGRAARPRSPSRRADARGDFESEREPNASVSSSRARASRIF